MHQIPVIQDFDPMSSLGYQLGQGLGMGMSQRRQRKDEERKQQQAASIKKQQMMDFQNAATQYKDDPDGLMRYILSSDADPQTKKLWLSYSQQNKKSSENDWIKKLLFPSDGQDQHLMGPEDGLPTIDGIPQEGQGTLKKDPSSQTQVVANPKKQTQYDPSKITDQEIAAISLVNPNLAKVVQSQKDAASKETSEAKKETLSIRQDIYTRGEAAKESIQNKENLIELIDKGNLNDPTLAAILDIVPFGLGKRFLSDDTAEYKSSLVDEFKDLRVLFSGATRVAELKILEDKMANLYLTDVQKKKILKSRMNSLELDVIKSEIAADVERDMPNLGLLQFQREVNRRLKVKKDSLANNFINDMNSIFKEAESQKGRKLDAKSSEDVQIANQIIQEAGGDRKKARQIAKKKGYEF